MSITKFRRFDGRCHAFNREKLKEFGGKKLSLDAVDLTGSAKHLGQIERAIQPTISMVWKLPMG